ncbi:MAG: hypothetical protein AAF597_16330 [Bacteroidota bacterium]
MDKELAWRIMDFSAYWSALPVIVSLVRWRRLSPAQRSIGWLVLVGCVTELLALLLMFQFKVKNTLPLLHLFTVIECGLLLMIFGQLEVLSKKMVSGLIVWFVTLAMISAWRWQPIYEMNDTPRSVEAMLLTLLAVIYFARKMMGNEAPDSSSPLGKQPGFWLATSVLLYFPVSLFIFLYGRFLMEPSPAASGIHLVHALLTIVKTSLLTIALWIAPTSSSSN